MRYLTYTRSVLPSDRRHSSRLSIVFGKGCGVAKLIPVLAMTLLVSACTGSSDNAAPETTVTTAAAITTTTVATTTTVTEPETTTTTIDLIDEDDLVYAADDPTSMEAELETAYYRSWDAYDIAIATPDPDHPDLALTSAGKPLAESRAAAQELLDTGRFALEGPLTQSIVMGITVVDEETGVVNACEISDGEFYNQDDPDTKISGGIYTLQFSTKLEKIEGRWKVVDQTQIDVVEGIGGCASFDLSS